MLGTPRTTVVCMPEIESLMAVVGMHQKMAFWYLLVFGTSGTAASGRACFHGSAA